jgi:hypothetical protein
LPGGVFTDAGKTVEAEVMDFGPCYRARSAVYKNGTVRGNPSRRACFFMKGVNNMGFFSDMSIDQNSEAMTEPQSDSTTKLSAISAAEKRDDARQQAEEDAAKAVLSHLTEESESPALDAEADAETDAEADTETDTKADAKNQAAEDQKRREHEEAEAKRKAEWETKKKAREEAEQAAWENAVAMSDDEVMAASMKRVGEDAERLTRRNMKACVAEHIQTWCLDDSAFARQAMHPRKNMINCFRYINRKARTFIEQEMKDNDEKPLTNGVYGGDVPDDLCYQWAEEYFMDLDAEEDKEKDEKFVPKPYTGASSRGKKKPEKKKPEPKKTAPPAKPAETGSEQQSLFAGQISFLDAQEVPA